jgi:Cdc6-like AAA superfamily ATPase
MLQLWRSGLAQDRLREQEFRNILRMYLTSARAISNPQYLRGRQSKLSQIDRAFNSPGKHIFIYGDRGVGKTSLALSASVLHQSVGDRPTEPIVVSCDQGSTAFQLIRDIVKSIIPPRDAIRGRRSTERIQAGLPSLGWSAEHALDHGSLSAIESINDAMTALKYVRQYHSAEPVIVIDEFDQ